MDEYGHDQHYPISKGNVGRALPPSHLPYGYGMGMTITTLSTPLLPQHRRAEVMNPPLPEGRGEGGHDLGPSPLEKWMSMAMTNTIPFPKGMWEGHGHLPTFLLGVG